MTRPGPVSMRERLQTDYRWTPRQREVLSMLARGKSNAEIATALDISLQGAKWHVSEVMSKLQADTREEAADYWRRYNGLAPRFARVFRGVVSLSALKWLGTVAVGAVVAAAGIAIAVVASGDGGDPPAPSITLTPAALPPVPSIAEARASIEAADPPVARLIEATLQSDVDALMVAFPVSEGPCEEFVVRGLPRCESAGLPAGTQIRLYEIASERLPGYRVDGETVGGTVAYLLDGRKPRLDLITRRDDGAYLVVIGIEPEPIACSRVERSQAVTWARSG
jgi:DNA-binding CsgD family transcriptional regulator